MRKILFVTERRADYSRFKPIIDEILKDPELDYYLIVTGVHLLKEYGKSINLIKKDGLKITSVIPMFKENAEDTCAEMVKAIGRFLIKITDELVRLKPDIVLAGFDIGANFALSVAAAHMNIPIGHVQGGEITGSIDESLRHAISKFSHFHFPGNKDAAKRLIRMGEKKGNIFIVGCPSLDALLNAKKISRKELERELEFDLKEKFILIIQHTITTEINEVPEQIKTTLEAVKELNIPALLLYPNNDAGGQAIIKEIEETKIKCIRTVSYHVFANILRYTSALVGNSSTGIHETPTFKVPTVNIGNRQQGRLRPQNVIDVPNNKKKIKEAIKKALYDKKFIKKVNKCKNPYGDGKSAKRIIKVLKEIKLNEDLVRKIFIE